MSVGLLDVNVLVALFDPAHINHDEAHEWFGASRKRGWATCTITVNGCVRVLSSPGYRSVEATPADVIGHLRELCKLPGHVSWEGSVSLLDPGLFRPEFIGGHRKVTDAWLLGLAVKHGGKLVTFDRGIPVRAVAGARAEHLELLGG